jgi:F-type H+-transporting ATPase subunit gamma
MSKRRDIETQLRVLHEIREIMNAMKNLSLMEVHKLSRFLESQREVVSCIRDASEDFLQFHQGLLPDNALGRELYLLIGSERGFCGDFNESLIRALDSHSEPVREKSVIVIGSRLAARFGDDARVRAALDGPGVVEEVDAVLVKLTQALIGLTPVGHFDGPLRLTVLHHRSEQEQVAVTDLEPLAVIRNKRRYTDAPLLYLRPEFFLRSLTEQYLFAALHELLYSSLMAENERRMQHMTAAVQRLERTSARLLRTRNSVRQEEITEEIEVIMLSVATLK